MPRTLFDPRNGKHRDLSILIKGSINHDEKTTSDIARILGVSETTALKYIRKPEKLSVENVEKLGRSLNVPIESLRQCIRY